MSTEDSIGKLQVVYSEMTEADQAISFEVAMNALKVQDKGEQVMYQKDLAQMIKQELDKTKGYVRNQFVCR